MFNFRSLDPTGYCCLDQPRPRWAVCASVFLERASKSNYFSSPRPGGSMDTRRGIKHRDCETRGGNVSYSGFQCQSISAVLWVCRPPKLLLASSQVPPFDPTKRKCFYNPYQPHRILRPPPPKSFFPTRGRGAQHHRARNEDRHARQFLELRRGGGASLIVPSKRPAHCRPEKATNKMSLDFFLRFRGFSFWHGHVLG